MSTSYNVINYDLSVATPQPLKLAQSDGRVIAIVSVLECPAGAQVFLRIGATDSDNLLCMVGRNFKMCPGERDGIFLWNPAAGAGNLQLMLSPPPDAKNQAGGLEVVND